jgi:hypothetical protein
VAGFISTYYLLAWGSKNKKGRKASGLQLLAIALIRATLFIVFFIGIVLFVGCHLIFIDHTYEDEDDV